MNNPDWLPPAPGGVTPMATRALRLSPNKTLDPEQSRLGLQAIVEELMELSEPTDVSFHYEAAASDDLRLWIRFDCVSPEAADHVVTTAVRIIRPIAPWLDVEPMPVPSDPQQGMQSVVRFALGGDQALSVSASASFLWTAVSQGQAPLRFSIALQHLVAPQEEDGPVRVRAEATLTAPAENINALARLAARDAGHRTALRIIARDEPALEGELLADIATIGRLLAGPFTVPALSGRTPILTVPELGALVASAVPPSVVWNGGSGLGKTTAEEHLIEYAADLGITFFVACPHGDLARRAATIAQRYGIEPIVYDFGAGDRHLRWNITRPDPGVAPAEWARRIVDVLRSQVWPEMPGDYFGPVWLRAMQILIETLASDPNGPWPLTRVADLLDPHSSDFRDAALARIGDRRLARALDSEVLPMVKQKDPGNSAIWLISKLDPLIGDPTVRRIIDSEASEVSMQPLFEGRSIIVSLPQSVLTEGGATVLAALLLERVWAGVRARRDRSQPIEVFVDEWQKIPSPAIPQMLAEGRKFGLKLRLANQHLSQLTAAQREAVLANTGLIGTFRTSNSDASTLNLRFPTVSMMTMQTLPKYTFAYTTGDTDGVVRIPAPQPVDEAAFDRFAAPYLHEPAMEPASDDDEEEPDDVTAPRGIPVPAGLLDSLPDDADEPF